ncbi:MULTISPECIES: siroheme decarboxylase subunit beta [Marinobacter]|uniref:siroheme decarboxylase n=1 Tax=Marinobacter xiaoshiensis TaxID=3073652 RepID=A0ABU2HJV2_9GAMM|nr:MULTISPECIES: Lrp/AsnC family transcriptional regulator [unclassified Marinobacter]MBK1873759.1 Lrp/AsnC family transcriptional regulator [Marinobacter sp. 1-3A]MBK1884972.1 Lrp/AsnC family transcriptional regulator [Marinobacter sp. DY40_1A1]MDS1311350.1 Lrp/AsnC family transcriptional regulator [Marinobacter sp. F60267]
MSTSTSLSEAAAPNGFAISERDRELILATQAGLPLVSDPWAELGKQLDMDADEVLARFQAMQQAGVIRRVAAVPDHYRLGYRYNGMTVWDVADDRIAELGTAVGELPFVSHCYRRPRHLPYWSFNLFAMVHGTTREEVEDKAAQIRAVLGDDCRQHTILYSSAILKKTGLRLRK